MLKNKLDAVYQVEFIEDKVLIKSGKTLQFLIGVLGMVLPLVLYLIVYFISGKTTPIHSISHYFYTYAGHVFVIILSLIGVFLILFNKGKYDFWFSTVAGIAALIVVLFPTTPLCTLDMTTISGSSCEYTISFYEKNTLRSNLHNVAAIIFILLLGLMPLFLFVRDTSSNISEKLKSLCNKVYKVSGYTIIGCVVLLILFVGLESWKSKIAPQIITFYKYWNGTFILETIAVECFGISWLIKSEPKKVLSHF